MSDVWDDDAEETESSPDRPASSFSLRISKDDIALVLECFLFGAMVGTGISIARAYFSDHSSLLLNLLWFPGFVGLLAGGATFLLGGLLTRWLGDAHGPRFWRLGVVLLMIPMCWFSIMPWGASWREEPDFEERRLVKDPTSGELRTMRPGEDLPEYTWRALRADVAAMSPTTTAVGNSEPERPMGTLLNEYDHPLGNLSRRYIGSSYQIMDDLDSADGWDSTPVRAKLDWVLIKDADIFSSVAPRVLIEARTTEGRLIGTQWVPWDSVKPVPSPELDALRANR